MTAAPTILGPTITSYLDRFERRRRRQRIVRAVGTAVMLTLLWASLWCVADRLAGLPGMVRLAALLVNGAGVFAVVTPSLLALARPADVRGAAAEIERRRRRFGERLMTITSRALGEESIRGSSDMLRAIGEEVRAEAAGHDPADLLPWRPVLGPWVATGLVAVVAPAGIVNCTAGLSANWPARSSARRRRSIRSPVAAPSSLRSGVKVPRRIIDASPASGIDTDRCTASPPPARVRVISASRRARP